MSNSPFINVLYSVCTTYANLNFSAQNIILLSINIAEKSWIIYAQYISINYIL